MAVKIDSFPGRSGVYILHSEAGSEDAAHTEVQESAAEAGLTLLPYGRGSFATERTLVFYWLAERRFGASEGASTG